MKGPETRLRIKIVKALTERYPDAYVRKIHGNAFQNIGIPDLLCCFNGNFIAMEIKVPGKKATPAQLFEIQKIKKAGGTAGVITSTQEALQLVESIVSLKRDRLAK